MAVTDASIVVSISAAKSEPATSIENVRSANTKPVYVWEFTVNVTVSFSVTSPPTVPVIAIYWATSPAFIISSPVIFVSNTIEATG